MNQIVDALPLLCRAVTETGARVHEMPTAQETWRELTARIVIVHLYIPSSSEIIRRKMMAVVHATPRFSQNLSAHIWQSCKTNLPSLSFAAATAYFGPLRSIL